MHKNERRTGALVIAYLLLAVLLPLGVTAEAQLPPIGATPTPAPQTPPPTPAPTPAPTPRPEPSDEPPLPLPSGNPSPSPSPGGSPVPGQPGTTPAPGEPGAEDEPAYGRIPPGFQMPILARTPARNTRKLVEALSGAVEVGLPLQEALIQGMGRFPVAGLATWSDDWYNPRFTPVFHLHEGLDIFADFGTPVRSPDRGVVTRITDGPVGGLAVWTRGSDGKQYYFAHLQEVAAGIEAGTQVEIGTVLGTVGDSGNARGGAPHLHFEIHDPQEVPPKPFVDAWLAEAEAQASDWVNGLVGQTVDRRRLLRSESALAGLLEVGRGGPEATLEYSVLLTLLDPIAGSVGVLPRIPLVPVRPPPPSERLMDEFIRLRVGGGLISVLDGGGPQGDGGSVPRR